MKCPLSSLSLAVCLATLVVFSCAHDTQPVSGDDPAHGEVSAADLSGPRTPSPERVETVSVIDLPYNAPSDGDPAMSLLDVYHRPDGAPKRLVVLVHGGSWVSGDKSNFDLQSATFVDWWLDRGYVVAAVNFRLATTPVMSPQIGPMDQARDIASALKWLDDNRRGFGVTERGATLVGFSSGAHLVALLGADGRYIESVGLPESHVQATISLDVHAYDVPFALELMRGSVVEDNIRLIRHLFGESQEEQAAASPISYADRDYVAPALLISAEPSPDDAGTHGYIVNTAAQHYLAALQAEGHVARHHHFDDETHSSLAVDFGADGDEPTSAVAAFLATL